MEAIVSLTKEDFMKVLNSDDYFVFKQEEYDEYLEWKSTLSDYELKNFHINDIFWDGKEHEPTFSWYMKNRVQLKQYYEQINDWRKLKPNQFLKKTNVERINYNVWDW